MEMTEAQKKMMEKLGLSESAFKAQDITAEERIATMEDAFAELCGIVFGGDSNG